MVSVCGVVVATIALVCALSVYNGFNDLVSSLFSNFDPELKIMPRKGKVFDPTSEEIRKVRELPGIVCFSEVLQDNALVRYRDRQGVATLKGVDEQYEKLAQIDSILIDGKFLLNDEVANYANMGDRIGFLARNKRRLCLSARDLRSEAGGEGEHGESGFFFQFGICLYRCCLSYGPTGLR